MPSIKTLHHNVFELTLIDAKTGQIKQTAKAYNVVLDAFYAMLNEGRTISNYYRFDPCICVGTGTGTPAPADVGLFQYLTHKSATAGDVKLLDNGVNRRIYSCTFGETEANGDLTEVGLYNAAGNQNPWYMSHALISDSEGNPITLTKTSADILNATYTVYSKVTPPVGFDYIRALCSPDGVEDYADKGALTEYPDQTISGAYTYFTTSPYNFPDAYYLTNPNSTGNSDVQLIPLPMSKIPESCVMTGISKSEGTIPSYNGSNQQAPMNLGLFCDAKRMTHDHDSFIRFTAPMLQSTQGNLEATWMLRSIFFWGIDLLLTFPNHSIYPPKELTFSLTGDGATTDFNLPIPEVMTEGVQVYVDGILADPSTYEFSGKNFNMAQAWASLDNKYVIKTGYKLEPASEATYCKPYALTWPYTGSRYSGNWKVDVSHTEDRIYDFGTSKAVNTFKQDFMAGGSNMDNETDVYLDYSADGVTWTNAATVRSNTVSIDEFETISARYWRIRNLPSVQRPRTDPTAAITHIYCGFDEVKPGIRFDTPPANEAVIQITCRCEYPLKNSNWRIDPTVLDLNTERGSE